jgi:hypothetical protein
MKVLFLNSNDGFSIPDLFRTNPGYVENYTICLSKKRGNIFDCSEIENNAKAGKYLNFVNNYPVVVCFGSAAELAVKYTMQYYYSNLIDFNPRIFYINKQFDGNVYKLLLEEIEFQFNKCKTQKLSNVLSSAV